MVPPTLVSCPGGNISTQDESPVYARARHDDHGGAADGVDAMDAVAYASGWRCLSSTADVSARGGTKFPANYVVVAHGSTDDFALEATFRAGRHRCLDAHRKGSEPRVAGAALQARIARK